jgi:hypothetical protein
MRGALFVPISQKKSVAPSRSPAISRREVVLTPNLRTNAPPRSGNKNLLRNMAGRAPTKNSQDC